MELGDVGFTFQKQTFLVLEGTESSSVLGRLLQPIHIARADYEGMGVGKIG